MSLDDFLDGLLDIAIVVTLLAILTGCGASNPPTPVELPQYHPPWPIPTDVCKVDWQIVLDDKNWPIVGIRYPENLDLKACNKDKARYIKQLTNIVCHYRPKDDPRCVVQEKDPL